MRAQKQMVDPITSAIMTVSHKGIVRTDFEMSRRKFVSIYGDGWLFFSQRCAIWCHTLAIFRYSARFSGEDFVLAKSMHSAANSRKSVDGSQSSKVISLSSFGIFLDIGFIDDVVGAVLTHLKDKGLDNNSIVIFTTDNGAENFTWPDGGQTPFAGGKGTGL